jgi:hypothetical protein
MSLLKAAVHYQLLERYLLGLLPDEEAERLDELSVADDEVAWRLRVVEDDLVDAYVRARLAGRTREQFESFYLSSERRRQKVRFARSLLGAVDRGARAADTDAAGDDTRALAERATAPPKLGPSYGSTVPRATAAWRLAAAAALLLLACGVLLYQSVRLRHGLTEAQRSGAALSRRAHDLEQEISERHTASPVADVDRNSVQPPQAGPARNTTSNLPTSAPEAASRALPTIALVLLPQARAIGPMATLAVPGSVDGVTFELRLDSNDFPRYRVALRDPGTHHIIWRSETLTSRMADTLSLISIIVPARLLEGQHYSLEVEGLRATGATEVVGSYAFQVVRR